jgi:diguanylate cyclase (GGDEF)-like protein
MSVLILVVALVFTWSWRKRRGTAFCAGVYFSLICFFSALYLSAVAWMRLDLYQGQLATVAFKYKLLLTAMLFSIVAYVGLIWVINDVHQQNRRWIARGLLVAIMLGMVMVFVEHPVAIVASSELTVTSSGVWLDYGYGSFVFYGVALAGGGYLGALIVSSWRNSQAMGSALNLCGFTVLFLTAWNDLAREMGIILLPTAALWFGYTFFLITSFCTLALYFSAVLQEREQANRQLERLNDELMRDSMTRLYSKRHLENRLLEELERSDGMPPSGGLLFVDLDDFKAVNDTYGHVCGDEVIMRTAALIKAHIRDGDIACRWGGDEFAIYLAERDAEAVELVAERLRAAVRQLRFATAPQLRVTLSMGYVALDGSQRDWRQVMERADAALYASKRAGKDQLSLA